MRRITHIAVVSVVIVVAVLEGCISFHAPPESAAFEPIRNLRQLEGVYRNRGESERRSYYLSVVIWGDMHMGDPDAIQEVAVRVVDEKRVLVTARSDDGFLQKKIFEKGKDFEIVGGRIRVQQEFGMANEGTAGPTYNGSELGIDTKGHGKFKSTFAFAGIVLLIPAAIYEVDEVRFVKLRDLPD